MAHEPTSISTLPYRQPRLVALILLVLIAAGLSTLLTIGRQEDPTITNLFATITTPFPGADPARVEALVTTEIEEVLAEIPEIDTVESVSSTGISIIQVELIETIAESRIEQVWSEMRDALADAEANFPNAALNPEIETDGAGAYAAIVALSAQRSGVSRSIMARYGEDLTDRLRTTPGTKVVDIFGSPEEELLVSLDSAKAAALGITVDQVSSAIRAADSKGPAGQIRSGSNNLVLEVAGDIQALDRLRDVIVREGNNGRTVRLAEIAEIERGVREPSSEFALQNGLPSIIVAAKLEDGLQVDMWLADIKAELDSFQQVIPGGMSLELVFDQSTYTADRLLEVGQNMAIGIALVVGVLFLTLGFRAAAIVAVILPIVTLASLATINYLGLAIHQMSVTGLIVALGLLVDAGIVMTDEVGRRIRHGQTRKDAVSASVQRLFAPLFASTVTTALSFTPMILLPGPAGDFVGSIAIAVVVMLFWSLIIAMVVTPAIAGWFMPSREIHSWWQNGISIGFLSRFFRWSIVWAVSNPVKSIALSLVIPVIGFLSMPTLTAQFFPGVDRDQFYIEVENAPGATIAQTQAIVARLDGALRMEEDILQVTWIIGRSAPAFYYNIVGGREDAPTFAQALITTSSAKATEDIVRDFQRSIGDLAPEAQILVRGLVQGPPVAAPVELRFVGPNLDVLRQLGEEASTILSRLESVTLVRSTMSTGAPKIELQVDEAKARLLGLDLSSIARQLDTVLEGATGGFLLEGNEQLPVRVRLGEEIRRDLGALVDLPIIPPQASAQSSDGGFAAVPLSSIANVELVPSDGRIVRRNGERTNTVQAFILREVLPEEALKEAQAELEAAGFAVPNGYRLELGGDSDARTSTLNNLLASVGLIVTLTIATIVLTFNSFRLSLVTLVVSGMSAGLSLFALAVFQYPFGINAIIGVIGSIGVSINAAIILMTGLQQNEAARNRDVQAMADVVLGSSRHIVSTTITTFGGFLPLILAGGGFWPPFAMAVAGGVLLSTIVSFYFAPPAFALIYARRQKATRVAYHTGSTPTQDNLPVVHAIAAE